MITIISHTVAYLEDPFGILSGERYEFLLQLEVPEDDELYTEKGIYLKVLFIIDDTETISHFHLYEVETNRYIDFELEQDEEDLVFLYCQEQIRLLD